MSSKLLADQAELEHIVRKVAGIADMRVLHLQTSNIDVDLSKLKEGVFEDEGGISVLALISTSHIALHTWPARKAFMFDLVSCKAFNHSAVREYLQGALAFDVVTHDFNVDVARK